MIIEKLLMLMLIASVMFAISIEIGMADEVNLTLEGHFGGLTNAVEVSGNFAFIGQGQDFIVLDISNPTTPLKLGRLNINGYIMDIKISNNYAYVADRDNGLVIIDISDPSTPYLAGNYDTVGNAYGITVSGSYAYVADYYNGLVIIDISDPSTPYLAGNYDTVGLAHDIAVSGSYAYVADYYNGLVIFDISDPSTPYLAGNYDTVGLAHDIAVSGSYAYVADWDNGLVIIDISDPSTPYLAGNYDTAGLAYDITVLGSYAYVADGDNGLVIIDISDPSTPYLAGNYDTAGFARDIAVSGSYAYVADGGDNGLVIIDISDPSTPYLAGNYDTVGSAHDITVSGSYAYVANGGDNGLVIIDISDPSTPYLAGNYDTAGHAIGITVSGSYAYVADGYNGLVIIDISDPSTPYLAGNYDTVGDAIGITVSGSYAYVADWDNGVVILRTDASSTGPQDRTLLQVEGHSEVYWLQNNKLYWVTDWDVINNMAGVPGWDSVNTLPESEFDPAAYTQGPRFITTGAESDGLLIGQVGDYKVYRIENGKKRHITYPDVMDLKGYSFDDVIEVSANILDMFPLGDPIGIEVNLYFNKVTNSGEESHVCQFTTGETVKIYTETTVIENYDVETYVRLTYPDGTTKKYAYHENPDFSPTDPLQFSETERPLYPGIWHAQTKIWNWNEYTFTGNEDEGIYTWEFWYKDVASGKILGNDVQGYEFTKTTPSSITITSPNGGENWQAGTTQTIQWSYTGNPGSDVQIELLKGGTVDQIITTSIPIGSSGSGSYDWAIPSALIPDIDYHVRISSISDTAYSDTSDEYFTIIASTTASTFGAPGSNSNVPFSYEPVNLGTGSYFYQYQDIFIPGRGLPLTVIHSYNSMDTYSGPFGSGWTFNYNINLAETSIGDVLVMTEDGRRDTYTLNPDGTYTSPLNVYDTLAKNSDGTYTLNKKNQVKYYFTSQGKLNNIIDKNGNQISLTYTDNYLTIVTDASGRELIFTYDEAGRIVTITDPLNRIWSYTYDDEGNLAQYSDPLGGQFSYTYDENHWMTSITDPRGNQIMTNTFDGQGRVISQSNALGALYTFSYDVANRKTTEKDPLGRTKVYAYDEHFWGLSETNALGNTISYAYDENGNRISVTNANGQTIEFAYDANGDIIQITDPLGYITSMTYDSKDNLISMTDALAHHTFLEYDSDSNLINLVNALGDETVFTYDEYGQIISGTNANGNTAIFDYDTNGNQIAITDALGNTIAFTYDIVSRLITTTDADGNTYTLSYDELDRLVSVTDPLGYTTSNTYDAVGNRISYTDAAGSITSYSYNPLNQLVKVIDAMGGTVSYNYDIVGNMISMTDANGHTTNYNYDPLNRPVSIIDPLGYITSNTYDAVGNRISFTDAARSITSYSYDPLNRLIEVTDAMGGSVYYAYDAVGNMMSMTDANGHITNYAYNALNRPVSIIDPLGHTTSSTYDAVGNVVSLTDANGKTTSFSYDGLNRLIEIAYPDGQTVGYSYDTRGNRLTMEDSHGTTNYQYDNLNRLVSVINPDSQIVGYMYDAVGNRIQITYPDGKTMTYGYDANNRLTGVTDWDGYITGYSYNANSNLIGMTYPNGMSTEFLYDENNQLIELIDENSTQVISSFEYTLDAVGNRVSVAEWFSDRFDSESGIPQVLTTSYEYDDLYRLTQVNYPFDEIVSYNYDPMGNRISMSTTIDGIDKTVNYAYDAADRLLQSGGTTYDYDNNGNMIRKTENPGRVTAYNYDGANRLINLSTIFDGSQRDVLNFEYDGDGTRLSKTRIDGKRTQSSEYLWDVNAILPQVLTESDYKDTTFYTHGLDLISMTDPKRGEFYYHYDGLGSVRSLSDSLENIKAIYLYDAFGQMRKEMGHVDNDFRFTGEQMDDETGLIYLRARYYDPSIGRFINKDPFTGFISDTQSLNRYSYVKNNPVRFVDPGGLLYLDITLGAEITGIPFGGTGTISIGERGIYFYISPMMGPGLPVSGVISGSLSKPQKPTTRLGENLEITIAAIIGKKITSDRDDISTEWVLATPQVAVESPQYIGGITHPWEDVELLLRVGKRKATPPWEDFETIGRATWRWMIPEAHSSELVMGK
jgi:RHS repeat-associated protein